MEIDGGVNEQLFEDYARFHEIQIANRDVDPVYPVLRSLAESLGLTPEERVRLVFLHVAYYDLGSALAAIDRQYGSFLTAFKDPVPGLKCGTERRRHRMGDNLARHLEALDFIAECHDGLLAWMQAGLTEDPAANWDLATVKLMQAEGNGRWAAYKTCEMLAEVCGLPLAASDMGHRGSSGPRQGLALLYPGASATGGGQAVINALNGYSSALVTQLQARGLQARMETAETTLCDFHSMVKGHYYPGLDIDVMQEQLERTPLSTEMFLAAQKARLRVLPAAYLGELNERRGPDRERKSFYKRTGQIIVRGDA